MNLSDIKQTDNYKKRLEFLQEFGFPLYEDDDLDEHQVKILEHLVKFKLIYTDYIHLKRMIVTMYDQIYKEKPEHSLSYQYLVGQFHENVTSCFSDLKLEFPDHIETLNSQFNLNSLFDNLKKELSQTYMTDEIVHINPDLKNREGQHYKYSFEDILIYVLYRIFTGRLDKKDRYKKSKPGKEKFRADIISILRADNLKPMRKLRNNKGFVLYQDTDLPEVIRRIEIRMESDLSGKFDEYIESLVCASREGFI